MCEGLVLVVGDIVSTVSAAAGALSYQPALTVEVIVTAIFQYNGGGNNVSLTDGANQCYLSITPVQAGGHHLNVKIGITNSIYFIVSGSGYKAGFTGIQTK